MSIKSKEFDEKFDKEFYSNLETKEFFSDLAEQIRKETAMEVEQMLVSW